MPDAFKIDDSAVVMPATEEEAKDLEISKS
jgi:hypothetical protein